MRFFYGGYSILVLLWMIGLMGLISEVKGGIADLGEGVW